MSTLQCSFQGCFYTATSHFSLSRHTAKCRFRLNAESAANFPMPGNTRSTQRQSEGLRATPTQLVHEHGEIVSPENDDGICPVDSHIPEECNPNSDAQHSPSTPEKFNLLAIAEMFSSMADIGSTRKVNDLIKLLQSPTFDMSIFKRKISSVSDCKTLLQNDCETNLQHSGFSKHVIHGNVPSGMTNGTLYKKDVLEVLQKQLSLAGQDDILFSLDESSLEENELNHPCRRPYFQAVSQNIRLKVMNSENRNVFWNDCDPSHAKSFVGLVQVYSDKTATTLKSTALVAYPVHVVLLNFTSSFRQFLIDHGHTLVAFLPVDYTLLPDSVEYHADVEHISMTLDHSNQVSTVPLDDYVPHTSSTKGRENKMQCLHESLGLVLNPLQTAARLGFEGKLRSSLALQCFPLLSSYCCDIPEGKDISAIRHGVACRLPCIRCKTTDLKDISVRGEPRHICDTLDARKIASDLFKRANSAGNRQERSLILKDASDVLDRLSLSHTPSILETYEGRMTLSVPGMYAIFTYEPLHNLHLGVSKLLKTCIMSYVSSSTLSTKHSDPSRCRVFQSMKTSLLRGCNSILAAIDTHYPVPGVKVDFSKKESSSSLNGLYMKDGLRGMLEGKDYRNIDMVFPFIAAFLDTATGYADDAQLTEVNAMYSDLVNRLLYDNPKGVPLNEIDDLESFLVKFKKLVVSLFSEHCDTGLFTMKFHLLDHLCDDLRRFGDIHLIDASPYEHFNVLVKQSYRTTSLRHKTRMEETVQRMEPTLKRVRRSEDNVPGVKQSKISTSRRHRLEKDGAYLPREGITIPFMELRRFLSNSENSSGTSSSRRNNLLRIVHQAGMGAIRICTSLLSEILEDECPGWTEDVQLTFVKTGFVTGGYIPTLQDYDEQRNLVSTERLDDSPCFQQRVFATDEFGPNKSKRNSFVLIRAETDNEAHLWVGKALLLFRVTSTFHTDEYVFLQYLDTTPPECLIDRKLGCICLKWATTDNAEDFTRNETKVRRGSTVQAGEWYGVEPISTIQGCVHVLRANFAVQPFTPELPWSHHRFYVNKYFRHPRVNLEIEKN